LILGTRACVRAGCGKFALRGLSQSLAREFQPAGVHIAHVIIDGVIGERRSVTALNLSDRCARRSSDLLKKQK
jgi:NAD(P)-dependent dehydrogenase (short-subunit alcohol dehydrogenase family)